MIIAAVTAENDKVLLSRMQHVRMKNKPQYSLFLATTYMIILSFARPSRMCRYFFEKLGHIGDQDEKLNLVIYVRAK
jgi:hypothetical protein